MWQVVVVVVTLALWAHGAEPGVKVALSQRGLNQGSHMLLDWLQDRMGTFQLPDVQGGVNIGIGTIGYILHDMSITQCDLPEPTLEISEGSGISVGVDGLSIQITGRWNTHFGFIHDGGTFELAVFGGSLDSLVELNRDILGHLFVMAVYCTADIEDVQLNFYGGASIIFGPFVHYFKGLIFAQIRDRICPAFELGVDTIDQNYLEVSNVSVQVSPNLLLDIPLTDVPALTESAIELDLKGVFYSIENPMEPPFPPNPFELPLDAKAMLSVGVSEFCVNTVAYALFTGGLLQMNITDDMIPKSFPFHLNTSQFGSLIPQLPKLYPNRSMQLLVYASKAPYVSLQSDMLVVSLSTAVKAYAVEPSSSLAPLFRLDMDSSFSGKAWIDNQLLKGSLALKNFTLTLGASEIGPFQTAAIETMARTGLNILTSRLNAKLQDGLFLPSGAGYGMKNSVLTMHDGFVAIYTDIATIYQDDL